MRTLSFQSSDPISKLKFIISELKFYQQTENPLIREQQRGQHSGEEEDSHPSKPGMIPISSNTRLSHLDFHRGFFPAGFPSQQNKGNWGFCSCCCRWWPWGMSPTGPWWRWWPGMTRITRQSCATPRPPWRTRWRGSTTCASWAGAAEVRGWDVPAPSSSPGRGIGNLLIHQGMLENVAQFRSKGVGWAGCVSAFSRFRVSFPSHFLRHSDFKAVFGGKKKESTQRVTFQLWQPPLLI